MMMEGSPKIDVLLLVFALFVQSRHRSGSWQDVLSRFQKACSLPVCRLLNFFLVAFASLSRRKRVCLLGTFSLLSQEANGRRIRRR